MVDIPPVTAWSLIRTVFLNGWGAVVGGLWSLLGVLDYLDSHVVPKHPDFKPVWDQIYRLPSFTWQTWVVMLTVGLLVLGLHGAYKFARDYRSRFEKLVEHKLIFEIDLRNTKVRVEQHKTNSPVRIFLQLQLRFDNRDVYPTAFKQLTFALERYGIKDVRPGAKIFTFWSIYQIRSNGVPIKKDQFEGMMIQGRRLTPWYMIDVMIGIEDPDQIRNAEDLDVTDFIEVTMESSGYQKPLKAKLHPHWKAAVTNEGTDQIIVTGVPSIAKDFQRVD
jgi:hypothetical protein